MHKQQEIAEPSQSQQEVNKERLKEIFADHNLDLKKHNAFFEGLLEWKKNLWAI